jgi:GNAT superfamily N-acetyltransferase
MRSSAIAPPPARASVAEVGTAAELEAARRLLRDYAEALGFDVSPGGHFGAELAALPGPFAPPAGSLLLAFVGAAPVGVVGLQRIPPQALIRGVGADNAGELKRLYVRPEFRAAGIGRALVLRTEAEARRRGYDPLVLTTSAELFPLAQGLYDALGYRRAEPYRSDMPWPGVVWLSKRL